MPVYPLNTDAMSVDCVVGGGRLACVDRVMFLRLPHFQTGCYSPGSHPVCTFDHSHARISTGGGYHLIVHDVACTFQVLVSPVNWLHIENILV